MAAFAACIHNHTAVVVKMFFMNVEALGDA